MNKKIKKLLIVLSVILLVALLILGTMILIKSLRKKPVKVYPYDDLCIDGFYMGMSESYGTVTADKIQKISLSNTQTLIEVKVKEGDTVNEGDPILSYDTSLGALDVEKAAIAVEKLKLQLSDTEAFLKSLDTALISENIEAAITALQEQLEREETRIENIIPEYPKLPVGSFTADDPGYIESTDSIDLSQIISDIAPNEEKYVVFVTDTDGNYTDYRGICFFADEEGNVSFSFFDPEPLQGVYPEFEDNREEIQKRIEDLYLLMEKSYSAEELVKLKTQKSNEIKELEVKIKVAEVDYQRKSEEAEDGIVYSKISGIVKAVRDPDNDEGAPIVEISGGGGYYIDCAVGEFNLDNVKVGDTVSVNSWSTGEMFTGEIVSVDTETVIKGDNYSDGNNNISWYAMRVFVSEDSDLEEGDYVSVTGQNNTISDAKYLENMFIRYDSGKPYVFAADDEGRLEKRYIMTGADMYGEYTEIKDGLSSGDRIAFPYGIDVVEGAKTVDRGIEDLYGDDFALYY